MAKISTLSLEELYQRKPTASVEAGILSKEDFSKIAPNWCEKVCRLKCKTPENVRFKEDQVDVLIVQDHRALDDLRFKKQGVVIENTHKSVINAIADEAFGRELTRDVVELLRCEVSREDHRKGNKPPTDIAMLKCRPYLYEEIVRRKPKVIISLSTVVTKALLQGKSNYGNRGEIYNCFLEVPVVITLHPRILLMLRQNASGKFWGPDFYGVILKDFLKAKAIALKQLEVPQLERGLQRALQDVHIARSLIDVDKFTKDLAGCGRLISFDTETTSLDPMATEAKLLTIQFGYRALNGRVRSLVIPLWHRDNTAYDPNEAWALITPLLLNENLPKVGHNVKFDVLYIYHTTGIRVKGIAFDTMLLLHAINSGIQGNYGLKRAVWDWLPESELGGYEDLLPKLTKTKPGEEGEIEEGDSIEEGS